jgi:hypothetical protein
MKTIKLFDFVCSYIYIELVFSLGLCRTYYQLKVLNVLPIKPKESSTLPAQLVLNWLTLYRPVLKNVTPRTTS